MTIHTKLARKVLTKKEQRHLTEVGINSMAALTRQIKSQKEMDPNFPAKVCFDCWGAACKLGVLDK